MIIKPIPYGHQSITQEDVDAVIKRLEVRLYDPPRLAS